MSCTAETTPRVVVILVGIPGSGKSTFSRKLVEQAPNYVRVNQDTIKGGRRGSREQCIAAAREALSHSQNVIIDRCNVEASQRRDFTQIAKELGCRCYCVVLNLPSEVCKKRAAERIEHEGGVQGKGSYPIVARMNSVFAQNGLPDANGEGFDSLMICEDERDVNAALQALITDNSLEEWKAHTATKPSTKRARPIQSYFREKTAFDELMENSRKQGTTGRSHQRGASPVGIGNSTRGHRHVFPPGPRLYALAQIADRPSTAGHTCLHVDDTCILILDGFPKSKHHALVVARDRRLEGPLDLGPGDLAVIRHMKNVGEEWAQSLNCSSRFKYGFHAVPSMRRLHLHVVSTDFESVSLKTKRHWNSFALPGFFLGVDEVEASLMAGRRLEYDVETKERLVQGPLAPCFKCGKVLVNMPDLKEHLKVCCALQSSLYEKCGI